jgi:hypothetical protein
MDETESRECMRRQARVSIWDLGHVDTKAGPARLVTEPALPSSTLAVLSFFLTYIR